MTFLTRMANLVFGRIASMRFGRADTRELPAVFPSSGLRRGADRNGCLPTKLGFVDRSPTDRFTVEVDEHGRGVMAHEIAKLMLEHADTFLDRAEAVKTAVSLGMPLGEIEEYLDWLDMAKPQRTDSSQRSAPTKSAPHGGTAGSPRVAPHSRSQRRPKAG